MTSRLGDFWRERHLSTLTTLRADGTPHVVPVGVVIDDERGCAWVITSGESQKVANIRRFGEAGAAVALCQVDGRRWSTLEGTAYVHEDQESVRHAERLYAQRYRTPRENPQRVALRIELERVLGLREPAPAPA